MNTYPYTVLDGHMIVTDDQKRYLVDTGAPSSISKEPVLNFAGMAAELPDRYLGINLGALGKNVGCELDALIGADILNQFDVLIDPAAGNIHFAGEILTLTSEPVAIDNFRGIPVILAAIDGKAMRLFFDTGAKISYLAFEITSAYQADGKVEDFYPDFGVFSTETYTLPLKIGSQIFDLCFGNLPEMLEATLMAANVQGILGTELLEKHRLLYSARRSQICIEKF